MTKAAEKLFKGGALLIGALGILITMGGLVWALSSGLANKASESDLRRVDDRVDAIHTDVQIIKREQRRLMHSMGVPVGKD